MVSDPVIRSSISDLVARLVDFLSGHQWSVVMPDPRISTSFLILADPIETFLALGRHTSILTIFEPQISIQRVLYGAGVPVPISVDTACDSSYFKFNLDSINLYNLGPDLSAEFDFRTFARIRGRLTRPLRISNARPDATPHDSIFAVERREIAARRQASRPGKRREPADSPQPPRSGGRDLLIGGVSGSTTRASTELRRRSARAS
jgi:hypothetical protein